MSYAPVKINFPPHVRGDKWPACVNGGANAASVGPITVNGSTPTQNLARVRLHFKRFSDVFTFDSDPNALPEAPIIITNPTLWEASIPAVMDFLPNAGFWDWDMEFWSDGDTSPVTLFYGTISVRQDVTN